MNAADNNINDVPDACANCGRGEAEYRTLRTCAACKMVKYCNRECQIAHRPQHKGPCKRRAAELYEEQLFSQPPSEHGDCPICMIRIPTIPSGYKYKSCCGKLICSGCIHAVKIRDNDELCPFCRTANHASDEECIRRMNKRIEAGDAMAIHMVGMFYSEGMKGLPQDQTRALELWHQSAELGFHEAYRCIGIAYEDGNGVEMNKKMAKHYFELAAIGGNFLARGKLGLIELETYKHGRALRHWMIAVKGGDDGKSLTAIQDYFAMGGEYMLSRLSGNATNDVSVARALRARQEYLDEIKSVQRDEAAAANDRYKYY